MKYRYDERGLYSCYFLLAISTISLIFFTWRFVKKACRFSSRKSGSFSCSCPNCERKSAARLSQSRLKGLGSLLSPKWLLPLGWLLVGLLLWHVRKNSAVEKAPFDPFEILGIAEGSKDREIRKAFRSLSLLYHPDKVAASENEAEKEEAKKRFLLIARAYAALTDPVAMLNWQQYGDPDGHKQSEEMGIALPAWLVEKKNLLLVFGVYCFCFLFVLPLLIRRWWSRSSRFTKDGVTHLTMALFYKDLQSGMNFKKLLEVVSAALEFKDAVVWDNSLDSTAIPALCSQLTLLIEEETSERCLPSKKYTAPYCVKTWSLLWAHCLRVPLNDSRLVLEQQVVVDLARKLLISGVLQICVAREWSQLFSQALVAHQLLTQALHDSSHPLEQLPFVGRTIGKRAKELKKKVRNVSDFLSLSASDQRAALEGLSDSEFGLAVAVASGGLPTVEIVGSSCRVLGFDGGVTCGSVATLTVTVQLQRSKAKEIESDDGQDNLQIDEDGNVVQVVKAASSKSGSEFAVHAPFVGGDQSASWWLIATVNKSLLAPPVRFSCVSADWQQNVSLTFATPAKPCTLTVSLAIRGDSVFGGDSLSETRVSIVASKAADVPSSANESEGEANDLDL